MHRRALRNYNLSSDSSSAATNVQYRSGFSDIALLKLLFLPAVKLKKYINMLAIFDRKLLTKSRNGNDWHLITLFLAGGLWRNIPI